MSSHQSGSISPSPHVYSAKRCIRHVPQLLTLLIFQLFLRIVALIPLIYFFVTGNIPGLSSKHAFAAAIVLCFPLYTLFVLPFRFYVTAKLNRLICKQESVGKSNLWHYCLWLKASMYRIFREIPWVLPTIALTASFYYYWNMTGFNDFGMAVNWIGSLIGGSFLEGVILFCAVYTVSIILAAYGWWRGMVFDYLAHSSLNLHDSRRLAAGIFRKVSGKLMRNTLINILICLPAVIVSALVLYWQIGQKLTGNIQFDVSLILNIIQKAQFPSGTLEYLSAAMIVLYLPFIFWRKGSNAVIIDWSYKTSGYFSNGSKK